MAIYISIEKNIKKEAIYEVGQNEGIAKGRKDKTIEIAKKLLKKDMPLEEISEITYLSLQEIKELQTKTDN